MVAPGQALGNSFELSVEKVFLCSGKEGYIPKYSPSQGEYGCVETTPKLQHRYRILVSGAAYANH